MSSATSTEFACAAAVSTRAATDATAEPLKREVDELLRELKESPKKKAAAPA